MNELIYVIDDEKDLLELVELHLKKNNFTVKSFNDASSFLKELKIKFPDLILLDLMLPDIDGLDICKQLKNQADTRLIPIIMLTAKQDETDKILGLEIGADDYITKPFSPKELVARVKALLRRINELDKKNRTEEIINIDDSIFIDIKKYEIFDNNNNPIRLTSTEFNLLLILHEKRGWVFSREKLLNKLWGNEKYVIDRTIDVHIKNLRDKLGEVGKLIKNIRGIGYKLDVK